MARRDEIPRVAGRYLPPLYHRTSGLPPLLPTVHLMELMSPPCLVIHLVYIHSTLSIHHSRVNSVDHAVAFAVVLPSVCWLGRLCLRLLVPVALSNSCPCMCVFVASYVFSQYTYYLRYCTPLNLSYTSMLYIKTRQWQGLDSSISTYTCAQII